MKIFVLVILVVILFVLYVRLIESTAVFYPTQNVEFTPRDIGLEFEDIYFQTSDGLTLNGWLLENPKAKATLLFCHGNAGNIAGRLDKIKLFHAMGLNVFIFDYRGYGLSEGKPSEKGLYKDAHAAYAFLKSRANLKSTSLIIYGASLGGAIAVDLVSKKPASCLIVDSSFSSAKDMAKVILPVAPSFLISTKLDSAEKVKTITIPKLFLHSPQDEVIPFRLGKKLYQSAASPKVFKETLGDHNGGYSQHQNLFVEAIISFLREEQIF